MAGILDIFDSMGNGFNQLVDSVMPEEEKKLKQQEVQKNTPKPSIKTVGSSSSGLLTTSDSEGETPFGKTLEKTSGFLSGLGSLISDSNPTQLMAGFQSEKQEPKLSMNPIAGLQGSAQKLNDVTTGKAVNPREAQQKAEQAQTEVPPLLKATDEQMAERNMSPEDRLHKNYADRVAELESSNRKDVVNKLGYAGKYQMGTLAMKDLGIINMDAKNSNKTMKDAKSYIKNKYGITSQEQFLNDEKLQDKVFKDWNNVLTRQLKSKGAMKYVGKEVNGVKMTKHKILAASHMLGAGAVSKALRNGTLDELMDGNNHSALSRMNEVDF